MTPESHLLRFPQTRAKKIESVEQERQTLKDLISQHVNGNTITLKRAQFLLRDIRFLERFLLGKNLPPEDSVVYHDTYKKIESRLKKFSKRDSEVRTKDEQASRRLQVTIEELRNTVGGMINSMKLERVKEFLANPAEFISFITGEPFSIPKIHEVPKLASVDIPEKHEISPSVELAQEQSPSVDQISQMAREQWASFNWENPKALLDSVRENFERNGLKVKVEFFHPRNDSPGYNYIIIAQDKSHYAQGIIVPRYGIVLKVEATSGIFLDSEAIAGNFSNGAREEKIISPTNLVSFPEVQWKPRNIKDPIYYWEITKIGEYKN